MPIPTGYVIGVDDTLAIRFWKDPELSGDVVVRSDGKISLALINDIQARGYTPQEPATVLTKAADQRKADPNVTVTCQGDSQSEGVRDRQGVSVGDAALNGEMNVLQALAMSGGLRIRRQEQHRDHSVREGHQEKRFKFDYNEVVRGKNTKQNIVLQPGDTIVVN